MTGAVTGVLSALTGAVPVEPSREQARGWAVRELAGREYADARPGLLERAVSWLFERIGVVEIRGVGFSQPALAVALLLLAAGVAYALWRSGGIRRTVRARTSATVLDTPGTTAAQHRAAADRHAAAGAWSEAVRERFRAIARQLEEDAVLAPQPGRTADELARDAGTWLPELAADLLTGARRFDDAAYGGLDLDAAADTALRDLDARVRRARPAAAPASAAGPVVPQ